MYIHVLVQFMHVHTSVHDYSVAGVHMLYPLAEAMYVCSTSQFSTQASCNVIYMEVNGRLALALAEACMFVTLRLRVM